MNNRLVKFLLVGFFCLSERQAFADDGSSVYMKWKEKLHQEYGIDYRLHAGFLMQRGAPNGNDTVMRDKYEIEANWDIFSNERWGSGSIQFLYEDINYSDMEASQLGQKIGVVEPINDDAFDRKYLKRFTYTHQFSGALKNISLSFGQFLIGSFGKVSYNAKPLYYFNNFSLAKNMTKGYPTGGFGGYITYKGISNLTLAVGGQDTTNFYPQNISLDNLGEDKWTSFMYASWTPKLTEMGKTVISGWIYHSPEIKKHLPQFDKKSNGWLLTIRQDIDKWTLFGKINGSTGNRMCIEQSYVFNIMYNNPLGRNELDQIGVGIGLNKISHMNAKAVRSWENVVEAYWNIGFSDFMTITPDIQMYINPALTHNHQTAFVSSLQIKLLL